MKELEKLIKELEDRFDRWNHLKIYGGSDPFHPDGSNMHLIRNHIFHYKSQIKELCDKKGLELPEIYYRETPPEVDDKYMARVDEIRKNAKRALAEYKASKDYQYLISVISKLNKKQLEQTLINNVIGYCRGLESFIEKDDLVSMRRHERYEHYLQSFWECRKRVEKVLEDKEDVGKEKHIQICMF
ncbi:hypothetical protein [Tissierella praeacuta]|uniref:hypothetical protein n=1 Tax=Tissierella praeacuta TaxID=43131 RepID=UPI00333F00FE